MEIFEIRDSSAENLLLGFLFYYEKDRRFYAELLEEIDEWYAPFIFSGQVHAGNSGVTVMGTTLSLETMNEKTLNGILLRNNIPEKQVQSILSARDFHRQLYFEKIKKTFVHEIMPVADDNQLFEGKIRVDIPEVPLTYTPQEYADHIREIMRISDSYINYRFFAIPDAPFSNTKISFSDNTVIVTRLKPPNISFIISHPAICEAFSAYAENIKKIYNHDKLTLNQLLKRYL